MRIFQGKRDGHRAVPFGNARSTDFGKTHNRRTHEAIL
jgi:hypothetical protein